VSVYLSVIIDLTSSCAIFFLLFLYLPPKKPSPSLVTGVKRAKEQVLQAILALPQLKAGAP
jgi:hypothetical protein